MAHRSTLAAAAILILPLAVHPAIAQQAGGSDAKAEQHIAEIKSELHITPAEEGPWSAFADVMRQNAAELSAKMAERQQGFGKMNAVDDLKSYAAISSAHSQEATRLVGPFETLYAALSPAQKADADRLFQNAAKRRAAIHG